MKDQEPEFEIEVEEIWIIILGAVVFMGLLSSF